MYGKYDPFKNITENVNLPIPLLTRFDLIFVVRDIPSKEKMKALQDTLFEELHTTQGTDKKSVIEVDLLTKYLCICKTRST